MKHIFMLLFAILLFGCAVIADGVGPRKRSYTVLDYICHKQPYLSICKSRSSRSSTTPLPFENKMDPFDPDPMPTPGPLPLDELQSAYDVGRRREQEEAENSKKAIQEEKSVKQQTDSELLKSIEEFDNPSVTMSIPTEEHFESTIQPKEDEPRFTKFKLNPRLRYQQYENAFQDYYRQYPSYGQSQNGNYGQQPYYLYPYQQQSQQYLYPSAYPYQYSYPNQQNGFNFGIGSQFMIPFAGPLGISSGFGWSG